MEEETTRYFLRFGKRPWDECTLEEFRSAERAAGFSRPTGGFGNGSIQGTTMHRQAYHDWSEGARLLTPLPALESNTFDMQILGSFIDYASRADSEKEWQNHANGNRFHITRMERALQMLSDNTLILTDNTPNQESRSTLAANLGMALEIMRRNDTGRVRYSAIKAQFGMK